MRRSVGGHGGTELPSTEQLLISLAKLPARLQPLQPAQEKPDILWEFFGGDLARRLAQRGAEVFQEVDIVDPGHVFGLLLHVDQNTSVRTQMLLLRAHSTYVTPSPGNPPSLSLSLHAGTQKWR
jgi:hypothetical protein